MMKATNALRERVLAQEGLLYLKEQLALGRTLPKLLLTHAELESGQIVTLLPPHLEITDLEDFRTGGKIPPNMHSGSETTPPRNIVPIPNTDWWIVSLMNEILADSNRMWVLSDALREPTDKVLEVGRTNYVTFDREVYHLVLASDRQSQRVIDALRLAKSHHFAAVATKPPQALVPDQGSHVPLSMLEQWAREAPIIV